LGTGAFLGSRCWDVEGTFRVRLGPLDYAQFLAFLPNGTQQDKLAVLTRSYVGPALGFELQLVLRAAAVPPLVLSDADDGPRLGWNTWLFAEDRISDASDAIFGIDDL
jgi:type VI secretion system protein ImpH